MANEPASKAQYEQKHGQQVEVRWSNPEHLDPVFADQMHLTRMNDQYYLTFGQIRPTFADVGKGPPVTTRAEVRPMVRITMSREILQKVADLISKGLADRGTT
jgi:hypothetical protein